MADPTTATPTPTPILNPAPTNPPHPHDGSHKAAKQAAAQAQSSSTGWFHNFLVKLENLFGIHPSNNVATTAASNELKAIAADNLTGAEIAQLDKTLQAIIAARNAANTTPPPVASTIP